MGIFDKRQSFKPLKGCNYHFIGDDFKIYRKWSNYFKELNGQVSKNGYKTFCILTEEGEKKTLYHRLIAENFLPNPENKPCINHKNGDKLDNRLENLEWCTHAENNIHALVTGLRKPKKPKISNTQVEEIREIYSAGDISQSEIAKMYDIHQVHVSRIISKKRRKNGSV